MSKYIDADPLIEFIDMGHHRNPLELCYSEQDVVDMIESRPTADVVKKEKWDRLLENSIILAEAVQKYQLADMVEVVRCKDCFKKESCRAFNVWAVPPSDEWFCADGERKEDDER